MGYVGLESNQYGKTRIGWLLRVVDWAHSPRPGISNHRDWARWTIGYCAILAKPGARHCGQRRRGGSSTNAGDETLCRQRRPAEGHQASAWLREIGIDL